ncbi:MAG: hypothetical protein KF726_02775 [Anaerolineae bacterium]|nr:hypothetical protein [Anaerolineae bacterium]
MSTIRRRVIVFLQLWFFVLTHTMTAGLVCGAACCVLAVMIVGTNSVSSFADVIRLLIYGTSTGVLVGGLFGGIAGIIAGFNGGIVIGAMTALFFCPPPRSLFFPLVVHIATLIVCVSAVNVVVRFILDFSESSTHSEFLDYVPVVFAAVGSYWVIQRMIKWYAAYHATVGDPTPQA